MQEYLRVGVITTTHGVHGEVKVYPTTDDAKRFEDLISKSILFDIKGELTPFTLEGVKFQLIFQLMFIYNLNSSLSFQ